MEILMGINVIMSEDLWIGKLRKQTKKKLLLFLLTENYI